MPIVRRTRRAAVLAAACAVALLVAGCSASRPAAGSGSPSDAASGTSGSTAGSGGRQTITIDATNGLRFRPSTIRAHVGTVTIRLVDTGSYPHDIDFTTLHRMSRSVAGTPGLMSLTLTVTFPRPGRYPFLCTYHSSAGMTGVFLVTR